MATSSPAHTGVRSPPAYDNAAIWGLQPPNARGPQET